MGTSSLSDSVTLSSVPRVHGEAALQKVGGRYVAATADEHLHSFEHSDGTVSGVAERILSLIDGHRSVRQLIAVLVEEYDAPHETVQQDALRFIQLLADRAVVAL